MSTSTALALAGGILGYFLGSSMGLAMEGTAYNAALFFTPLGAFVGWLVSGNLDRDKARQDENQRFERDSTSVSGIEDKAPQPGRIELSDIAGKIFWAFLVLLASVWNFHVDIIKMLGLLQTFVRFPIFFAAFCVAITIVFPPFLLIYSTAWLAANSLGASAETNYRAIIK